MFCVVKCQACEGTINVPEGYDKSYVFCPTCQKLTGIVFPDKPAVASFVESLSPSSSPSHPPHPSSAPPFPSPPLSPSPSPSSPPSVDFPPPTPPAPTAVVQNRPSGEDIPELMKANKRMVGNKCSLCGELFQLGQPIHNCRDCRGSFHQTCWNRQGGCGNSACVKVIANSQNASEKQGLSTDGFGSAIKSGQSMIPCRFCREAIPRGVRKCRHCGELQSDADRQSHPQASQGRNVPFVTQLWGFGIMLIFGLFLVGEAFFMFVSFAGGRISEMVVMGIGACFTWIFFRLGRGLQKGERRSVWVFCLLACLNLLYCFALLQQGPHALIPLLFAGFLFLPPIINAFSHWDEFH